MCLWKDILIPHEKDICSSVFRPPTIIASKKSLKIPKGQSEIIYRRTTNNCWSIRENVSYLARAISIALLKHEATHEVSSIGRVVHLFLFLYLRGFLWSIHPSFLMEHIKYLSNMFSLIRDSYLRQYTHARKVWRCEMKE